MQSVYISDLCDRAGFRIEFRKDGLGNSGFWGVNTLEKIIFLFNVEPTDYAAIEGFLKQADMHYRFIIDSNQGVT